MFNETDSYQFTIDLMQWPKYEPFNNVVYSK